MRNYIAVSILFFTVYSCTPPSMLIPVAEQNFQNIKSYSENVEKSLALTERLLNGWLETRVSLRELRITNDLSKFIGSSDSDIMSALQAQIKEIKTVNQKISEASAKEDKLSKEELKIYLARRNQLEEIYPIASDIAKNLLTFQAVAGDIQHIEDINNERSLTVEERRRLKEAISKKYSYVVSAQQASDGILNAFRTLKAKMDEQRHIAIKHSFAMLEYSKAELPVDALFKVIAKEDVQGAIIEIIKTGRGEKEAKLAAALLAELSGGGK